MKRFKKYLGNIDALVEQSPKNSKKEEYYIHPALKNAGCITMVVIREAIAPVVFRNLEQEITDIEIGEELFVRAVPNKFKYPERGRGLQILRAYGVGGKLPQNKTHLLKSQKPSHAFDMNTLVFGDSTNYDNRILPVRAGVNYSDGLSLLPKYKCVDETFHNRAMEDGTLYDAENKKNSNNLFTRHFIMPGTLMVQVISTRGKVLPAEGLDHLLLSMGVAGLYGGQTSVTGVNIRTHLAGLFGSKFERPQTSPYEIVKALAETDVDKTDCGKVVSSIYGMMEKIHNVAMNPETLNTHQDKLITDFESDNSTMKEKYLKAAPKVAQLFDSWFLEEKA